MFGALPTTTVQPTILPLLQIYPRLHVACPRHNDADKQKYDSIFEQMQPEGGKVSGQKVAPVLKRSGLPNATLHTVWKCERLARV